MDTWKPLHSLSGQIIRTSASNVVVGCSACLYGEVLNLKLKAIIARERLLFFE